MSTQNRTAHRGGKNSKLDSVPLTKSQKNDSKMDTNKILDNPKAQPTAEQMRIAQIIDRRTDDSKLKEKIKQIMDATRKTEDEVITALHDCDNDLDSAVNMLLEGEAQGEWETSGKKKKNRQTNNMKNADATNNKNAGEDDLEEETPAPATNTERERSRNRGGGPPRLRGRGGNENRNWRGRENKENEQNNEEGYNRNRGDGGFRRGGRGMSNGPGGRSGRGGRSGGRLGPRTFQSRDKSGAGSFPRSIETWNNPPGPDASGENNLKMENWGDDFTPEDWDNEEYTGSLADSKVFTPSGGIETSVVAPEPLQDSSNQEILMSNTAQEYHQTGQLPPSPLPVGVGTLNAAQTQYLSQLTAQSENLKSAVGIGAGNAGFGQNTNNTYGPNAPSSYGQTDPLKSVGSSVSYNQSSGGNTYQSSATSYGPSSANNSSYGPSGTGSTAYGQTTGYGQSGQSSYGTGSASSSYGQTSSNYGQSATNYGQQSQSGYGQSQTSAFQSQQNANTYGQTGSGMSNATTYQSGGSGNAYSGTNASTNAYQNSGTSANLYQSAGSGSGGSYPTPGTVNNSGTTSGVYPGTGSQGASYPNPASQNVNYQGTTVSGSNYSGGSGAGPGGSNSYQSGSASFHSGSQPSVFTSQNYNNSAVNTYGSQLPDGSVAGSDSVPSQPPRTKTQRARVPPPSKIPQSAVEMPDDSINASISFLDVQFGGLEFGSEGSAFDGSGPATSVATPAETTSTPTTSDTQNASLDGYSATNSSSVKNSQATLVGALAAKSVLTSNDALGMQSSSDHKTGYSTPSSRVASSNSGLDLSKSDVGLSYSAPSSVNYQSYQSQKTNSTGSGVYQQTGYSTTNFTSSTPQVTSSTSYSSNQSQPNNYNNQSTANNSFSSNSYSQASNAGVVNYPNSVNTYPSSNSFPNSNQPYQSSGQSVYGSALSSGYTSTNQYQNSYGNSTTSQNKLNSALSSSTKDSPEYAASTTVASLTSTTNSGLSNATLTCVAQTVVTTSTKVSSATTKSSVIANIPPGVPPIMGTHQYIMSQGGMPYFQTPMYSFEELQLLQQRIPHMATGYYDMAYQAPTSLATGRDSMGSVAYTMSDARYTRGDNNASPVPSTLSQQTATQPHQQPMMNHPSLPPGYAYFYGAAGMMPGSFQYGTPALYPLPAATNAHGSTTSQYPKPGSYSAYGSGYEGLSQTQDYTKSAYVSTMSANQAQSKSGVGVTSGSSASSTSDLNASMYGKSHTALGKVNSYEKQGFHSGTPPPYNLIGNQNAGMAHSGAYGPQLFIPTLAPHQSHHSATTLLHQPLHQDSGSSSGPRTQSSAQANKTGNKQNYNAYWPQTMN
ncbi:lingerer, putative [Pediculus humanus corporis]|uniref:Lingerer, putative n=1 Tax=Pediculus humanus subsp. corporis TaxID=121224 RepID=E0VHH8_PEDHC|nr:lingerer, putative [Pediculus humanus corporis]EEB12834.1 lingerer, putative [Pediculus humanus corporis]